jgi:hypothetical protein
MSTGRTSFLAGFEITDRVSCERAIRNGGMAGLFSAAITGLFAMAGLFVRSSDPGLKRAMDPWALADVALIVVLAAYVFRKSRVASTLLVVYYVLAKLAIWSEVGTSPAGFLLPIIFMLYYVTAMRGTYLWHSKYRDAPERPPELQMQVGR